MKRVNDKDTGETPRSWGPNHLVSMADQLVKEIRSEQVETNIDAAVVQSDRDPLCIYDRMKRYPRIVVWELTLACNMHCKHCGSSAGKGRSDELHLERMLRLCDELAELECERLTLLGGEPLIHPNWEDVTARLKAQGVRVNVITNGWLLDEPRFCDRVDNAGFSIVGISIDGMEKTHDDLRRSGSFQRVSRGMDLLQERNVAVAAVTVLTRESIQQLEELYGFLIDRGVKVWQLQIAAPLGRLGTDDPKLIDPQQIRGIFDFVAGKKSSKSGMVIDLADNIGYFPPGKTGFIRTTRPRNNSWLGCPAGIQVLGIDSNGDLKGCQSLPSIPAFIEGNVRDRSLEEIWNDPKGFGYNRRFTREQLGGFCAECRFGSLCKAGCSSMAYSYTGSTGDNPMCVYRVYQDKVPDRMMSCGQLEAEGKKLIASKDFRRALPLYERAAALNPQDPHLLDVLGFLHYMTGHYRQAADCCRKSIEIEPNNTYALKGLGLCLVELDSVDEGIALVQQAIAINPDDFEAHYDLAVVYLKIKRYEEARRHLVKASAIDPSRDQQVNHVLAEIERLNDPS